MSTKLYAMTVNAYFFLQQLQDYARKLERGDADSSGSTLRTAGVVFLVIAVVISIGAAVYALLPQIRALINTSQFNIWPTIPGGAG